MSLLKRLSKRPDLYASIASEISKLNVIDAENIIDKTIEPTETLKISTEKTPEPTEAIKIENSNNNQSDEEKALTFQFSSKIFENLAKNTKQLLIVSLIISGASNFFIFSLPIPSIIPLFIMLCVITVFAMFRKFNAI